MGSFPSKNSSTGGITDVYDLIRKYHAYIVGEKIVKVEHCLLVYDDTQLEEIREVYSIHRGCPSVMPSSFPSFFAGRSL